MPYDQIIKGVLVANSRNNLSPEDWIELIRKQDSSLEKGFFP